MINHKTHCIHGHAFTPENTIVRGGHRRCRTCHNRRCNKRYRDDPDFRAKLLAKMRKRNLSRKVYPLPPPAQWLPSLMMT
jgi:hypothetical protein